MNLMSYLQIKIRLLIMNIRLQTAKKRVLLSVKNSRKTTDKMDYEYSRFLSLAEKREELYLQLIYVTNAQTTRPMLDTSFDRNHQRIETSGRNNLRFRSNTRSGTSPTRGLG